MVVIRFDSNRKIWKRVPCLGHDCVSRLQAEPELVSPRLAQRPIEFGVPCLQCHERVWRVVVIVAVVVVVASAAAMSHKSTSGTFHVENIRVWSWALVSLIAVFDARPGFL